jgi:hypothetical protein
MAQQFLERMSSGVRRDQLVARCCTIVKAAVGGGRVQPAHGVHMPMLVFEETIDETLDRFFRNPSGHNQACAGNILDLRVSHCHAL